MRQHNPKFFTHSKYPLQFSHQKKLKRQRQQEIDKNNYQNSQKFTKKIKFQYHEFQTIRNSTHSKFFDRTHPDKQIQLKTRLFQQYKNLQKKQISQQKNVPYKTFFDKISTQQLTLRKKYQHLVEENEQIITNPQIKNIINVQSKLDNYLNFLEVNRNKRMGQSFGQVKKRLSMSSQAYLTITIFKQILYIAQDYYQILHTHTNADHPFLIRISPSCTFKTLDERKKQFKKRILQYIKQTKNQKSLPQIDNKILFQKRQIKIQIPQKQITITDSKNTKIKTELKQQKKVLFLPKQKEKSYPNQFFSKNCDFKQKLYNLIKQKQMKQLQEKRNQEINFFINHKKQIAAIIDQIFKIYTSKDVNNVFLVSLIQNIYKKMKFLTKERISFIIKQIQIKCPGFIKILYHSKGQVAQINKKKFQEAKSIVLNDKIDPNLVRELEK